MAFLHVFEWEDYLVVCGLRRALYLKGNWVFKHNFEAKKVKSMLQKLFIRQMNIHFLYSTLFVHFRCVKI